MPIPFSAGVAFAALLAYMSLPAAKFLSACDSANHGVM